MCKIFSDLFGVPWFKSSPHIISRKKRRNQTPRTLWWSVVLLFINLMHLLCLLPILRIHLAIVTLFHLTVRRVTLVVFDLFHLTILFHLKVLIHVADLLFPCFWRLKLHRYGASRPVHALRVCPVGRWLHLQQGID